MPIENGQGPDGGMQEPRALTVSNVIKEIQVLKDKFKSEDEDHCKSMPIRPCLHEPISINFAQTYTRTFLSVFILRLQQSRHIRIWRRRPCCRNAESSMTPTSSRPTQDSAAS